MLLTPTIDNAALADLTSLAAHPNLDLIPSKHPQIDSASSVALVN